MEKEKGKKENHEHEKESAQLQAAQEKTITIKEDEYNRLKEEAAKASEYWDRLLRLQADFENTRKRLEREKADFIRFANEGLISELLNILDDLERVVELAQAKHEDLPAFLRGVEMILVHLHELLKKSGIKPIEAKGKLFDPHYHEAMMQVEDSAIAENSVVEELQKGYLLHDRVIRTVKVKVSKKDSQGEEKK
ncbi:MAG: nucleotide exchange factor GrpE [Candidatus Omnitrophota bacterium]|nr:MAG: nucleotide exchange factor GrpE [Candidatus Omnitrophota bacterium]